MSAPQGVSHDIPADIIDAAIEWTVKLDFNSPSFETRHAFACWLQAAPLHGEAWRRMQSLRKDFAGVPPLLALDTLQAATRIRRKTTALQRRQILKLFALSAATVTVGWQSRNAVPWQRPVADASTGVGEQSRLDLGDGASLTLNTDTAIDRDPGALPRWVRMRRGELFVATDARAEPLRVRTPFGDLEAANAQFAVRLESDRARVTVREGRLRLYRDDIAGDSVLASAGQSWSLGTAAIQPAAPQYFDAIGWLDGVIAARDMRLADLLAELARYRHGRISCDAAVADRLISGIYHVHDTDSALQLLAQTQSLQLGYRTRFWVSVGPAA